MRVGDKQKKIDINIPKFEDFIHKCYINVAREVYKNVYLFEITIAPLNIQKNNRELEIIIQECILNTIRDSIPIENILKAYMDECVEEVITEEIIEQKNPIMNTEINTEAIYDSLDSSSIKFNDLDSIKHSDDKEEIINAPKNIERLEEISVIRNNQRKLEEESEHSNENDNNIKLNISDQNVNLSELDVHIINPPEINLSEDFLLDDMEILT